MASQKHTELQRFCLGTYLGFNVLGEGLEVKECVLIPRRRGGEELVESGCGDTVDVQRKSLQRKKGKHVGEQAELK